MKFLLPCLQQSAPGIRWSRPPKVVSPISGARIDIDSDSGRPREVDGVMHDARNLLPGATGGRCYWYDAGHSASIAVCTPGSEPNHLGRDRHRGRKPSGQLTWSRI